MSTKEACTDTPSGLRTYTFAVGEHELAVTIEDPTALHPAVTVGLDHLKLAAPQEIRTLIPALRYAVEHLIGNMLRQRLGMAALERTAYGVVCRAHLGTEPAFDAVVLHLASKDPARCRDQFALLTWRDDAAEPYRFSADVFPHLDLALLDLAGQVTAFGTAVQRAHRTPAGLATNLECSVAHARLTEESRLRHIARIERDALPQLARALVEASTATMLRLPAR